MSVTTVPTTIGSDRSATTTGRLAFIAIAIAVVVLLAASFLVGRVTADTSKATTSIVPAAHSSGNADSCPRFGHC